MYALMILGCDEVAVMVVVAKSAKSGNVIWSQAQ
jgi:hypothetical protein